MKLSKLLICAVGILAFALPALAQVPTGTLTGRVDDGSAALPAVLVTVASPSLQGVRTAVTSVNGDYIFNFLPPGEYTVRFELLGFQTQETTVKMNAAQTQTLNATMPQAKVAEEVTVTGSYETVSGNASAATTFDKDLMNKLPLGRTLVAAVLMAPGVHNTGPANAITISGAQSYENLFMINGVVVNENIRGQATNLFIEDAIQETTTTVSGVSAEYGRFAGGVVNMLTKSGGNQFTASVRDTLDNNKWTAATPLTVSRADKINGTYEATFGGKILTDMLWFFLAGRDRSVNADDQTRITLIPFPTSLKETRYEGKLTFSPSPSHRLIGSYISRKQAWTNYYFASTPPVDLTQLYPRSIPETLIAGNYTGVLSNNFFIEGQYSKRTLTFKNSGGLYTDLIKGTPLLDRSTGYQGNAPTFCGVCGDERRDNNDYLLKASYFLSTAGLGSHDIVVGADQFYDTVFSNNHQSGSDWDIRPPQFKYVGQNFFPVMPGGKGATSVQIVWWPIPELSQGTDFKTKSAFINDRWRLNNNWSFNVGVRYDKNDGKDALGKVVAKDSAFSPRLGLTWDPKADGEWTLSLTAGRYVTAIADTGNVTPSAGGNPSTLVWFYQGDDINTGATGPYVSPADAIQKVWDWFNTGNCDTAGNCGTNNAAGLVQATFRGYNRVVQGSLKSPYAEEMAGSVVKRFGSSGLARLDYIHRDFNDLYETYLNIGTGKVDVVALGRDWGLQDLGYIHNSSYLRRTYDGVNLQMSYRLDRWSLGGNYTWSHTRGNFNGETSGSGPVTATASNYYPEYQDVRWSNPAGNLSIDQRHKGRVWAVWDAVNTRHNRLSLSLVQSYFSGTPYGAIGLVRSYLYVTNPGYITRPTTATYYYTRRDAFLTDNVSSTDLAVNYSFHMATFGSDLEFFVQPAITNVFNLKAVTGPNATVLDRGGGTTSFADFNPFTTTPKECPQGTTAAQCTAMGANWQKGTNFGKPTGTTGYQTPRTISISFGVRF